MNITTLAQNWLAYRARLVELGSIAPSTHANQTQIVSTICKTLGQLDTVALRKSHVDLFIASRRIKCKPGTVSGELDVLRQILNFAVDEQIIPARPRLASVPIPNVETPLPSDEDYAWYLRTMAPKHGDALQFMLLTGLAPHELERLHVCDLNADAAEIRIGQRADFRVKQPSRRRSIPLNVAAARLWFEHAAGLPQDAVLWPSAAALQKAMRRHFLARSDAPARADGLTPKMMRKWFASKIATKHSEAVLQSLLGHAPGSPITRRHYVRSSTDQRRNAVDTLQ